MLRILAIAALLALTPQAQAQTVMKLASATVNDVQHEWQKVFVIELQKRVGDKVKTEIYPASQLGAIPRMVEGVLLGTIESFVTPTSFMVPTDPRFTIYIAIHNPRNGGGGGSTAGPVFSQLMGFTLHRYGVAPTGRQATVLPVTW